MKMGRWSLAFGRWPLVVGPGQNPATDLHGLHGQSKTAIDARAENYGPMLLLTTDD
jgi:hypothetical protein